MGDGHHAQPDDRRSDWSLLALLDASCDMVADPMLIVDAEGMIVRANTAFRTMVGSLDAFYSAPLAARMRQVEIADRTGQVLPADRWPLARILAGEELQRRPEDEIRIRALDGHVFQLEPSGRPVRTADGGVIGAVIVYHDVTAMRQIDQALSESETRLHVLTDTVPVLSWIINLEAEVLYLNQAWQRFTGLPLERLQGRTWFELVHPDDRAVLRAHYGAALATCSEFAIECRMRRHDEHYRWLLFQGVPRRTADGTCQGYAGAAVDISDRRAADEAYAAALAQVEAERRRLATLLEVLPAGVAMYDAAGKLLHLNDAGQQMLRIDIRTEETPETRQARFGLLGLNGTPLPEEETPSGRARRGETFTDLACIVAAHQDDPIYLLAGGAPLTEPNGAISGAVVVFQNVTMLHQLRRDVEGQRRLSDTIIASTPFGIALFDTSDAFRCLRSNPPFRQLLGSRFENRNGIRGIPLNEFFDLASSAAIQALFEQVRASGDSLFINELAAVPADEQAPRWYRFSLTPLRNADEQVTALLCCAMEITELVRAREAQRREAAQLRAILDTVPVGVAIADAQGRPIQSNRTWHTIWGEQRDAVSPPEQQALARVLQQGLPSQPSEQQVTTPDGKQRIILTSATPITSEGGEVTGAVAAALDLTDQRQWERDALTRAAEIESIFAAMTDGIVLYDPQGQVRQLNEAAQKLLSGRNRTTTIEAVQLTIKDVRGAEVPREQWPARRLLRGERLVPSEDNDLRYHTVDGRSVWISASGVPLRRADGSLVGAVEILRDVTERHEAEVRLRGQLSALLQLAQTAVSAGGDEQETVRMLAKITQDVVGCKRLSVYGIEPDTYLLRPLTVLGLSEAEEAQWWAIELAEQRRADGSDPRHRTLLSELRPVVLDMTQPPLHTLPNPFGLVNPLYVPMQLHGRIVGFLAMDFGPVRHSYNNQEIALAQGVADLAALVVERERLLRQRARAEAQVLALEDANRRMDEFLGIASHELKTPLTSLSGYLQLAQRRVIRAAADGDAGQNPNATLSKVEELLSRTRAQIGRLDRLVDDLLDVTRIHTGRLDLRPVPSELAALVRTAVDEQRDSDSRHQIVLQREPQRTVWVMVDPDRISQVVTNYLTNALKYSDEGTTVWVGLESDGRTARVWVRDEGQGIPPEEHEQIWERFHRVPGVESRSGSVVGLGMGLYICRSIVEQHGGQVGVQSETGRGATFWFTLPAAEREEDAERLTLGNATPITEEGV